jgi:HEAT repeat protein
MRIVFLMFILMFNFTLFAQVKPDPPENQTTGGENPAETAPKPIEEQKPVDPKQKERDQKGAEYIKTKVKFGTHKERAAAISDIKKIKTEPHRSNVLDMMVENLKDETDPSVLRRSFLIAAEYKRNDAIDPISKQIDNTNEDIQIAAVYALKELNATGKSMMLKDKLKSLDFKENQGLVEAILITLGEFGEQNLFEFAKRKIEDPNTSDFNRQRLILFFGQSKTLDSSDYLKELFQNDDESVTIRSYAVSSLSKLGNSSVVPAISSEIEKIESYPVKKRQRYQTLYTYCLAALVNLGDSSAYPRLETGLKSNNAAVRLRSVQMMEDLKDKRSIDILKYKAEYDQSAKVRKAAKVALKNGFDIDLDEDDEESELEDETITSENDEEIDQETENTDIE